MHPQHVHVSIVDLMDCSLTKLSGGDLPNIYSFGGSSEIYLYEANIRHFPLTLPQMDPI